MDLATLGFATDTSGLDQASTSLQRLPPAARAAETAANNVSSALGRTSAAARVAAAAIGASSQQTSAAAKVAAAAAATQAAANDNVTASFRKLAAIQDVVNKYAGVQLPGADTSGRAEDIAAYGKSLDALRAKYDPLFAAGQQYKASLGEINNALKVGALNEKQHAAAIMDTKIAFVQQVNGIRGVNEQFDTFNNQSPKTRAAYKGLSADAKNLSFQLVDITQGLASGQPLFQIFAQQAGQVGQVLATSQSGAKGLFKEIFTGIASVLTPIRLLTLGIIGIGIAFVTSALSVIKSTVALDDLSKSTDVALGRLHALQQLASGKGISQSEFADAMDRFSISVSEAQHNTGSLNGLMIATGKSAKDVTGYMMNVADIVAQTSSGVQRRNILEAAGLPTTQNWVKLMSQGGDAIKAAINNTVGFNDAAEKNLIQKARDFDEKWNTAISNFSNNFKSAFINILNGFDTIQKRAMEFGNLSIWTRITNATGKLGLNSTPESMGIQPLASAPNGNPLQRVMITGGTTVNAAASGKPDPKTQAQLLNDNYQAQQRISILGDLATVQQQVTQKQLELNAAGLQGVGVNSQMAAKILLATQAQAEQNRVNQMAAAGIFNLSAAQKAASDTLQHWIDQKLVDPTNTNQMAAAHLVLARNIKATSDAAAIAAAPLQQLKQLELDSSNFAKVLDTGVTGALNNLVQPIQDVSNGVTKIADGFKNAAVVVLQAIQQMIIKMLVLAPIAKGLQSIFSPWLGVGASSALPLPGMGSFIGPVAANAAGGVYNSPSLTAYSGSIVSTPTLFRFASGAGLMGEAGPEGILPLKRGPSGALGVQMFGQTSNDNSSATSVTYAPQYHIASDVSKRDIQEIKAVQAEDRRNFTANVFQAQQRLNKRNYR